MNFVNTDNNIKIKPISDIVLDPSWKSILEKEFLKPYMLELKKFLISELKTTTIYPKSNQYFEALNLTPFDKVKVVILGQDPYHEPNQAHGLCFSVNKGVKIPPSLQNIYKEIHNDLNISPINHGYLKYWAKQGVLLLNSVLTVKKGFAGSHRGKGWEQFTDAIIKHINDNKEHVVFLLWGRYAIDKAGYIDRNKHLVLTAAHPSPLSAYNGFFGCHHFSKTNQYLISHSITPIDWNLSHDTGSDESSETSFIN